MSGYRVSKTFGHDLGLSATFRQHKTESHCRLLHGYALSFTFVFACDRLDANGWVIDFGSFGPVREWLRENFDHRTLVAKDDPSIGEFRELHRKRLIDMNLVDEVGCEAFARMAHDFVNSFIRPEDANRSVRLVSCEVREHSANSATYYGP